MNYQLAWNSFNWEAFQTLSMLVAEAEYPGTRFDDYLKQGAFQDGIDLLSLKKANGRFDTIQCKRVKKFNKTDLQKVVDIFLKGDFAKISDRFIITVTSITHHSDLQLFIYDLQTKLRNTLGIELEVWGLETIEKNLRSYWAITAHFFGKEVADKFCIPQVHNPQFLKVEAVKNYIPRKIIPVSRQDEQSFYYWPKDNLQDLQEKFTSDRLQSHMIGIVGGPYFGKSTYLRQIAYLLHKEERPFYPLFVEVKEFLAQPLEQLLDSRYGWWQTLATGELILMIDGLDEARTDHFVDLIDSISTFAKKYPSLHIVISCRKLFYEQYNIPNRLSGFTFFELYRLEHSDVDEYIKKTLKGKYAAFMTAINKAQLGNSLYHPFYLENIVSQYDASDKLPKSKIKVVEAFIESAYEKSADRKLAGGKLIRQEKKLFLQTIKRFALALQISGLNAMNYDTVQELFTSEERDLLQHNSMVNISEHGWSFTNAMFQEHFAALALVKLSINQIIELSSVGLNIRKIRMKWLQTLASLTSTLNDDVPLLHDLLRYFREDNIELLFMVEPTKFDRDMRFTLLKEYINKVDIKQVRNTVASETQVGDFVDGIPDAVDYLLTCLENKTFTTAVKTVCSDVLESIHVPAMYYERLRAIALEEILSTTDAYYAANLINNLISSGAGNPVIIKQLVMAATFKNNHEFRQSVYTLIKQAGLSDTYYDYALEGLNHLVIYNKGIRHGGSEYSLEELLLDTSSYQNIKKLFVAVRDEEWMKEFHHYRGKHDNFLGRLFDRCTVLFPQMPLIIFPFCEFLRQVPRYELESLSEELDKFFSDPNAELLATRIFSEDVAKKIDWHAGAIITEASFAFLLYEMEERGAKKEDYSSFAYGLHFRRGRDENKLFWEQFDGLLEGGLTKGQNDDDAKAYHASEARKRANDRKYIGSRKAFKKGIENFYKAHGKRSIDIDEVYIDTPASLHRQSSESNFLFRHMIRCKPEKAKHITISQCLKVTEKEEWFEYERATYLLDSYNEDENKDAYLKIMQDYFNRQLQSLDFVNAHFVLGGANKYKLYPVQVGQLFVKFEFSPPPDKLAELLWLDTGNIRNFDQVKISRSHAMNKKADSIAELVLEQAGNSNLPFIRDKVLEHIKFGIQCKEVLGTHFSLSWYLNIPEAADAMLTHIIQGTFEPYRAPDLVKAFLHIGGNKDRIIEYFLTLTDYNSYTFLNLIELLKDYPSELRRSLLNALNAETTTEENKVTIARHLCSLQVMDGYNYLVAVIEKSGRAPYTIQGNIPIYQIDTASALQELERVLYMIIDPRYTERNHFQDSADSIIREWLNQFAAKSEADLHLVISFLQDQTLQLEAKYGDRSKLLNFYIERMLENFRSMDNKKMEAEELSELLKKYGY